MTPQEHIARALGEQALQIAILRAELDQAKEALEKAERALETAKQAQER